MPHWSARDTSVLSDDAYQDYILGGVSRTFALTIPQLPPTLYRCVGNAYLLCRYADTIEDDPDLPGDEKSRLSERFIAVLSGEVSAEVFARECSAALSPRADEGERDLARHLPRVLRITHRLPPGVQRALRRCVKIMATGMAHFQRHRDSPGLADMAELDRYCYHVAGVVGEMLTEFYGEYSPALSRRRADMLPLAVSFGQGLQMTNILKDIRGDLDRGVCWLPRSVLRRHGVEVRDLAHRPHDECYDNALGELIGVAHGHLRNALRYTLMIPPHERGIRRFCLWALGMAVLTLRNINRRRDFRRTGEVKLSRLGMRAVIVLTTAAAGNDRLLTRLFEAATRGLPEPAGPVTTSTEPLTGDGDCLAGRLGSERPVAAD